MWEINVLPIPVIILKIFRNKVVEKSCKMVDFNLLEKTLRVAVEDGDE